MLKFFTLCFGETDFLILQRPTDLLDKAPDCSAYLGFIPEPGVVATFSESFPFPCNGNDHDHSALQSTLRPTGKDQLSAKG